MDYKYPGQVYHPPPFQDKQQGSSKFQSQGVNDGQFFTPNGITPDYLANSSMQKDQNSDGMRSIELQSLQQKQHQQKQYQQQQHIHPSEYEMETIHVNPKYAKNKTKQEEQKGNRVGNMIAVKSGFEKLRESEGIFIKQKFEVIEAITNCETRNVYNVYPADRNGKQISKNTLFKCKEKSGFCVRQCCSGDCRPFDMRVSNYEGSFVNGALEKALFLNLERHCKVTVACFNRPEMVIMFVEKGVNRFLGKVKNPCYFCKIGCDIEDSSGNLKYIIEGRMCSIGFACQMFPCKACQEINFEVQDSSGQVVTILRKQTAGCLKACCGDVDNFALGFPPSASPEEKALLLAATLFIDYMYFENNCQKKSFDRI